MSGQIGFNPVPAVVTASGKLAVGLASGGNVTQTGARTNAVTLDTLTGVVYAYGTSLAAGAVTTFTVNNSEVVGLQDVIVLSSTNSTPGTSIAYVSEVGVGYFDVTVRNLSTTTADTGVFGSNWPILSFMVLRGAANP